jgi:SRSO17 transposase
VLDDQAWPLLRRLTRWLDEFKDCFGHRAQRVSLRQYIDGLLSDSPRKSMSAMLARVTEPGSYQALQHFITDAPWNADAVWRRLRTVLPERRGFSSSTKQVSRSRARIPLAWRGSIAARWAKSRIVRSR